MADDKRITELVAATLPLAGTEELEIVQGGVNKRTPVSSFGGTVADASTAAKGIIEIATDAEVQTGSSTILAVVPSALSAWWTWIKTQAQTFAAQITFTLAPIISSATASKFVRTGASKEIVTVDSATQAEMLAGADDTKPVTPASFNSLRSLSRISCSVSAGTMNVDAGSKREIKFENTTAISSATNITVTNKTNLEVMSGIIFITGTVALTFESDIVMEEDNLRWNNATKVLTVVGGTASPFLLSFNRLSSTKIELRASYKIFVS